MSAHTSPTIDLYDETIQIDGLKADRSRSDDDIQRTTPRDNGDVDEPALSAGGERLEAVLGW